MPDIILRTQHGVNATDAALLLPEGEYAYLQNVRSRPLFNLAKRQGVQFVAAYDSGIYGIFDVALDDIIYPVIARPGLLTFNPVVTPADQVRFGALGNNMGGASNFSLDLDGVNTIDVEDDGGASSECPYELSFSLIAIDATAQDISVDMSTFYGCSWNAVPNDSWLTTVSGDAHLSQGTYVVHASANTGAARSGTVRFYRGSTQQTSLCATLIVNQDAGSTSYKISGYTDSMWGTRATFGAKATDGAAYPAWDGVFPMYDATNWVVINNYWFTQYFTTVLFPPAAQPAKFTYMTAAQSIASAGDISTATRLSAVGVGNWSVYIYYFRFDTGSTQVAQYLKIGGSDPLGVYNLVAGVNPPSPASITIISA